MSAVTSMRSHSLFLSTRAFYFCLHHGILTQHPSYMNAFYFFPNFSSLRIRFKQKLCFFTINYIYNSCKHQHIPYFNLFFFFFFFLLFNLVVFFLLYTFGLRFIFLWPVLYSGWTIYSGHSDWYSRELVQNSFLVVVFFFLRTDFYSIKPYNFFFLHWTLSFISQGDRWSLTTVYSCSWARYIYCAINYTCVFTFSFI